MSGYLWKSFLENDVESFRQLLAPSGNTSRANAVKGQGGAIGPGTASPGTPGAGTVINVKARRKEDALAGMSGAAAGGQVVLGRADINRRDVYGRTLLHLAASSGLDSAAAFAAALLEHPLTDIYVQDLESGWTALHRAFYHGNVSIACAILNRDAHDALGSSAGGFLSHSVGLIKIKDREGNGPLDLFTSTVDSDRNAMAAVHRLSREDAPDEDEDRQVEMPQDSADLADATKVVPTVNLMGDEVFTFGSNRNVTLGFGDEDDRQFPERITLRRPAHLLQRFHAEYLESKLRANFVNESSTGDMSMSQSLHVPSPASMPAIIQNRPIIIQEVYMAKLHTAVLTTDPESNLYVCGHGQGGRLGTGDARTRYHFTCIEGGALSGKQVVAVALGQNHTLATSCEGDMFSWGSNGFGQLGYTLPKPGAGEEEPIQLLPRQIFGSLKRETILGIAASRIHSVAHTATSLFTFGKNEGQLGIVDSDARSLESQVMPRKVAASLFSYNIASVAAIDRATICLLENHDVYVFANYGYAKISFSLDNFTSPFSQQSFTATRYETTPNQICKITAGGNTICALSTVGEVFTLMVDQPTELGQSVSASTTNPSKIRGALSPAHRIWDLRKGHMAARDVGVDQDGSIILTTDEGSVWRRVRRAKIQSGAANSQYKAKDYKFTRVTGLTRVVAVRSSAFGAYAAVRRDCQVPRNQIEVDPSTLSDDMFGLFSLRALAEAGDDSDDENPAPRFWKTPSVLDNVRRRIVGVQDAEKVVRSILSEQPAMKLPCDLKIKASTSEVTLPLHRFILAGRSRIVRAGMTDIAHGETWTIPDLLTSTSDDEGVMTLLLHGVDFLTVLNLVLYLYSDMLIDFWIHARHHPILAFRYRSVRTELLKIATALELTELEHAVRLQVPPRPSMNLNLEFAFQDPSYLEDGDVVVQLADCSMRVHSAMVCLRCPFFEGLFVGRAGGRWLSQRPEHAPESNLVSVDLKHADSSAFAKVLRHIYADTGPELFDDVVTDNLDAFLDVVIDVMSLANELMLDRLSQICQQVVGKYVTVRSVCQLLNAISPCSVTEFKDKSFEYICLNLEALLAQGLLNELDEDLLTELDESIQAVQLRCSEVVRSGELDKALHEAHPELSAALEAEKAATIETMMMAQSRRFSADRTGSFTTAESFREYYDTPASKSPRLRGKFKASPGMLPTSPSLGKKKSIGDFMFDMDEVDGGDVPSLSLGPEKTSRHHSRRPSSGLPTSPPIPDDDQWYDSRGKKLQSPGQSVSSSYRKTPISSPAVTATPPRQRPVDSSSPWARSPMMSKLDMKDIMAQASSSRASSLSLALSGEASERPNSERVASFQMKQSQKARKKMQAERTDAPSELSASTSSSLPMARGNPWQPVQRPKKDSPKISTPDRASSPGVVRTVTAPALTMRQTVAGNRSAGKGEHLDTKQSQSPAPPGPWPSPGAAGSSKPGLHSPRSPDTRTQRMPPGAAQRHQSSPASIAQPTIASPVIQTIRYTPHPRDEPAIGYSMADILSQQQAEKTAIHEAATAKRSLQEIQQEQEFQQWWDMESRRVMDEEERRTAQAGRQSARGGGAKSRGKRGKGTEAKDAAGPGRPLRGERSAVRGGRRGGRPGPGGAATKQTTL